MKKIASYIFLSLVIGETFACSIPKPGLGWDKFELIKKSERIILAKVKSISNNGNEKKYILTPIKVLRGEDKDVHFFSFSPSKKHYGNDYNLHKDGEFWMSGVGRSIFPCCICGPDHTFIKDELYLLFPDSFGAMKSGEIIRDTKKDEWYQYVLERINE